MCSLRGEKGASGSYRASGTPLKPLQITPGKGVVPVPGSLLPRMAPVDQQERLFGVTTVYSSLERLDEFGLLEESMKSGVPIVLSRYIDQGEYRL